MSDDPPDAWGLQGRLVQLVPVTPAHHDWVAALLSDTTLGAGSRFPPGTASRDAIVAGLWRDVAAQFVVMTRNGRPVGAVAAYGADLRNGHLYLAATLVPELRHLGWPFEGVTLFLRYLLRTFAVRKVYVECAEPVLEQYASLLSRGAELEGRFIAHTWLMGRYVDWCTIGITRDVAEKWLDRFDPAPRETFGASAPAL